MIGQWSVLQAKETIRVSNLNDSNVAFDFEMPACVPPIQCSSEELSKYRLLDEEYKIRLTKELLV